MIDVSANQLVLFGAASTWLTPLWLVAVGLAIAVAALMALATVLRWLAPKVAAIARTTGKEALSQPLFYVLLIDRSLRPAVVPLRPLQHPGRRHQNGQGRGSDVDHGVVDHHGPVDGQRVDRRGDRGTHGADAVVETGRPAAVHFRQVPGHPCPRGDHVFRPRRVVSGQRVVQSGVRCPRIGVARSRRWPIAEWRWCRLRRACCWPSWRRSC